MKRHPCHRDRFAFILAACGQGDAQNVCGIDRIVKEQFVKVTHAEKQKGIGMLLFDIEILYEERRWAFCAL